MFLKLSKIRTPDTLFEQVYAPDRFDAADELYTVVAPVSLRFDIHKTDDRFRLAGRVQTTLELPCSRCLEPFTLPVDAEFDLLYHPHSTNVGEGDVQVGEEDLATAFYEDDQIDLALLMREQFYLALPMKPLCSDACHGLCPLCGTNLNRGTCDCKAAWEDPRLAVLKALKDDINHKGH